MKKLLLLVLLALLATMPVFAQKSFDMRYNEAVEYYTQKQYDKAIKVLEAAKKSPGVTSDQVAKATRFIKQCQASKQKMADLNLSKESVFFSGAGQKDSVYVTAGKAWQVTSHPEWCTTWSDSDIIYLSAKPNDGNEARQGVVEVTMGKERTAYVLVTQDKRQDFVCPVRIHTVPGRAIVYVDNGPGMLTEDFSLGEGSHKVMIEKSGYLRKDTTIVVTPANADGMSCVVKLSPTFATVSVNVKPADGYEFESPATLDISGNEVNLHPNIIKSFNVDQELSYYSLYEDNLIPLHPGQYVVKAFSEGFKPASQSISLDRGRNQQLDFTLVPICGTLSVYDEENAAGAVVYVDGKMAGEIPVSDMVLKKGKHSVRVVKEGFMPDTEEYEVNIEEDKRANVNVSMQPYSVYNIYSEPLYCKVYLDGKPAGTTPLDLVLLDGSHELRFEKSGYYSQTHYITTDLSSLSHEMPIELDKAYPVFIASDKDSLGISITQARGKKIFVSPSKVKTPAEITLPLSKKPYHIELLNGNRTRAYRSNFTFRNPRRDRINILTWANGPAILAGQWYLVPPPAEFAFTGIEKSYQRIADANFLRFKVFPGLSTSLAKASFFWENGGNIIYPNTSKGKMGLKPGDEGYQDVMMIPAISLIFLNGELRMGGALTQHIDLNLLATYAWYPDVSSLVTFTHMSGHDAFAGLELNSRIPVFNVSLRAGVQAFYGKANIARPNATASQDIENQYVILDYNLPVQNMQFVVGVGFSLGGPDSRGQNIIRIF
ncbi:MAG: PEGA domain-containing protein [Bacteroidales bacterium]|nr:PEGA domain-containing protein [Bacteroidales bacterium]